MGRTGQYSTFWELEHVFVLFLELEGFDERLFGHGGDGSSGDLVRVCSSDCISCCVQLV